MSAILGTFVLSVITGIIVLCVQYGVFERKKPGPASTALAKGGSNEPVVLPSSSAASLQAGSDNPASLPMPGGENLLSWPAAIEKAVKEFSTLHPTKHLGILNTHVDGETANLLVSVSHPRHARFAQDFGLTIRRNGEIIRIVQKH